MKKQDGRFNERFGRNLLINGDFSVWQRGENFPDADGVYTADRMTSYGTVDVSRVTGDISNGMTVGSAPDAYFIQKIEGYTQHSGKTYTISIWATDPIYTFYWYDDQGAAHPVLPVPTGETNGSWVRYASTFTVPFVPGDPVPSLDVRFDTIHDKGSDTYVTDWQLEEGPVATPFEHRPAGLELMLCQRYFQVAIRANSIVGAHAYSNASQFFNYVSASLPVRMRVAATVTIDQELSRQNVVAPKFHFGFAREDSFDTSLKDPAAPASPVWFGGQQAITLVSRFHLDAEL